MTLTVWDEDGVGDDDIKSEILLDANGSFSLNPLRNRDGDDNDPDDRLDLYFQFEVWGPDIKVSNSSGDVYKWRTATFQNIADGTHHFDFNLPSGSVNEPAGWVWLDTVWSWDYIHNQIGTAPGDIDIKWSDGQNTLLPCISNSCFFPFFPISGVFISDLHLASADIVRHEVAHNLMYRARGDDFWFDIDDIPDWKACVLTGHSFFESTTPMCAHTEGWASYVAISTDGNVADSCYDFGVGPCMGINLNLETPNRNDGRNTGDSVEARSAGTYLDLVDTTNEGMDNTSYAFFDVWGSTSIQETALEFWGNWYWAQSDKRHYTIQTLFWNSIEYNHLPVVAVPDMQLTVGSSNINLCSYVSDFESTDDELDWILGYTQGTQCVGVSLASYMLSLNATGEGYCYVGLEISDGIGIGASIFRIDFGENQSSSPGPFSLFLPTIHSSHMVGGC